MLHSVGLFILCRVRQRNPFLTTQRLYLIHLSLAENFQAIFLGLYIVFDYIGSEVGATGMYILAGGGSYLWSMSVLIMFTFDRFLTVYYNLRYLTVWSTRKTKQVLGVCFFGAFAANIGFLIYFTDLEEAIVFFASYIWITIDDVFIATSVATYIYIYRKATKQSNKLRINQNIETPSGSIEQNSNNNSNNKKVSKKSYLIPMLLITTFVIFIGLPNNTTFVYMVSEVTLPSSLEILFLVLYPIGLISDALIYIIFSKDVANYFWKLIRCK